jgi:hypothetical protein
MKNKFFQVCAGISMILLAAGFFVRSFSPAIAAPLQQTSGVGTYQMALNGTEILVWNTTTGQCKLFHGLPPSNPLGY